MMAQHVLELDEVELQAVLMALAHLSVEKQPGLDDLLLNSMALRIDNDVQGRAEMYDWFRKTYRPRDQVAWAGVQRAVEEAWARGAAKMRSMAAAETLRFASVGCQEDDITALLIPPYEAP